MTACIIPGGDNPQVLYERCVTHAQRSWIDHAACRGMPVDIFFPTDNESANDAKRVCATCTVRAECLEDALLDSPDNYGIRGGLSVKGRDAERRRRRQGWEPGTPAIRFSGHNAKKDTCPKGHPLADAYKWFGDDGYWHRQCRACQLERAKRRAARAGRPVLEVIEGEAS